MCSFLSEQDAAELEPPCRSFQAALEHARADSALFGVWATLEADTVHLTDTHAKKRLLRECASHVSRQQRGAAAHAGPAQKLEAISRLQFSLDCRELPIAPRSVAVLQVREVLEGDWHTLSRANCHICNTKFSIFHRRHQ